MIKELVEISKLFIPVIAMVGIYIAYQQHRNSQDKLRLDLYEKRLEIYEAINKAVISISWGTGELEAKDKVAFEEACDKSEFLFRYGLRTKIQDIRNSRHEYLEVKRKQERDVGDDEKMKVLYEKEDHLLLKFKHYQKTLRNDFSVYLQMERV